MYSWYDRNTVPEIRGCHGCGEEESLQRFSLVKETRKHGKSTDDFADAVLEAFRKRSRAFARRGAPVECTPVKEIVNGHESEIGRTDVRIVTRVGGTRVRVSLNVWGNRRVWVDARRASKSGWVWEYTAEGRLISRSDERDLVARTENTLNAAYLPDSDVCRAMDAIWSACLASGPRRV
jgi:hypothetical protein